MERTRMKRQVSMRWSLLAGAAAVATMAGCELIVDFDRTKIPIGGDASAEDATVPDGSPEADGSPGDSAASETGPAAPEAGVDAGPDVTVVDAGPDSTVADAADTGTPEASVPETSTPDAPSDVVEPPEASPEAAPPPDDSGADAADGM
jgi:hypothetical protein